MKNWNLYWVGLLAAFGLSSQVWAQAGVGAAAVAGAPGVAAAPAKNIFSFFALTPEQRSNCKARYCNTVLGQMINGMVVNIGGTMTGGLMKGCCLPPTVADIIKQGKDPAGAEGAAAAIKADEAAAKARREAVRYLGTVDCHYWPEAEAGLIDALRGDRNECVRLEAAIALNRGCCCTKKIMVALTMTISGSDKDAYPSEKSERVKLAAAEALAHCSGVFQEVGPGEIQKETLTEPKRLTSADFYKQLDRVPREQLAQKAREALAQTNAPVPAGQPVLASAMRKPRGAEGVFGIVANAMTPKTPVQTQPPPQIAAAQHTPAQSVTTAAQPTQATVDPQQAAQIQPTAAVNHQAVLPAGTSAAPAPEAAPVPARRPAPKGLINIMVDSMRSRPQRTTSAVQGQAIGLDQPVLAIDQAPAQLPGRPEIPATAPQLP